MIKPWQWTLSLSERTSRGGRVWHLKDGQKRDRATIWEHGGGLDGDFVWHTWDEFGTGGENASAPTLERAKDECVAAIVRQDWAPGGWRVSWS
jgi:hypothetical protein